MMKGGEIENGIRNFTSNNNNGGKFYTRGKMTTASPHSNVRVLLKLILINGENLKWQPSGSESTCRD